ncbi:uncharacterized protein [Apostichopus japonicus]|uniref:uncharacterized protein n=1 Tax=Stichopus japonicus TaxID=307972 RepID=UPI003AB7918F
MTPVSLLRILVLAIYINVLILEASDAYREIQFEDTMKIYSVLEGDTIRFSCNPRNIKNMLITTTESTLVYLGSLDEALSDEFAFECNETNCALTIKQIERKHGDEYDCSYPKKSLIIEVLSSPSHDYPVCNSSYTSTTFFLDSFQEPFNFSCLSAVGFPAVNISLSVNHGDGEINNISDENVTIYETNETVSLSYSSYLDSSFNNSTFVCTVTQQLPAPYQSYNKSCSFGPLKLPVFSVSIHPSYYTVTTNSTENITLMCTSNVSGVVLEWTNIPLDDWNYNITRIKDSLQLKIIDYGASIDLPITIQCSGSYGGITMSQNATIGSASTYEQIHLPTIIIILIIAAIAIVVIIAIIVVLQIGVLINRKRKRKKQQFHALSLTDTAGRTRSPNDNNANNVNVGHGEVNDDRHSSLNDATSNMIQDDTEMVDNPIYGSNRKQDLDSGRISGSNSSIEMTGNVVYESYKPKTLRMEENQEEGNYAAIVSV